MFQEPKTGVRSALSDIHGVHLMYVAEIVPPAKTAVEAFESKYIAENECEVGGLKGFIQRACFTGLKKDVNYCVKVRTVVNGKTICQVSEDIAKDQENLPTETQEAPI